jgi:flagellar protein FlgJ
MRAPNIGLAQNTSDLPSTAGLDALKRAAANRDPAAAKATASRFESLFAEQLIKSMRQTSMGDAMFPGAAQNYRELYDREVAKHLTQGKGLGLQPMIRKALGDTSLARPASATTGNPGLGPGHVAMSLAKYRKALPAAAVDPAAAINSAATATAPAPAQTSFLPALRSTTPLTPAIALAAPAQSLASAPAVTRATTSASAPAPSARISAPAAAHALPHLSASPGSGRTQIPLDSVNTPLASSRRAPNRSPSAEDFVTAVWPHAQRAAAAIGVSPQVLVAQAALETGWGKYLGGSNNLFGIKAGTHWTGATRTLSTTEYSGSTPHRESASFRSYSSVADSFDDFARMLKSNPRYAAALGAGSDNARFANALQKAGYATDPAYAAKITSIANGPAFANVLQIPASAPLLASR